MFRWKKITLLTYHLAFIVILIGASTTRYFGTEGMMHIREGKMENKFVSDDLYLQIKVDDKAYQYEYDKRLYLSPISNNHFSIPIDFLDNDVRIKYVNFIPNVTDSLIDNVENRAPIIHYRGDCCHCSLTRAARYGDRYDKHVQADHDFWYGGCEVLVRRYFRGLDHNGVRLGRRNSVADFPRVPLA